MSLRIFKRLSILLICAMFVGILHTEKALADENDCYIFKKFDNGYSVVMQMQTYGSPLFGIADPDGNIVLPIEYYQIDDEADGLIEVHRQGGLKGFVDKEGKIVIPVMYDDA